MNPNRIHKKFLGVDESNHGRVNEIYVGISSILPQDIQPSNFLLDKPRKKGIHTPEKLGAFRDFRYIVIHQMLKQEFNPKSLQVIVLAEYIKHFDGLDCIYIDGEIQKTYIKKLNTFNEGKTPSIIPITNGDRKIPLLNLADGIAYYLYSSFYKNSKKHPLIEPHLNKIITPKIEDYLTLLTRWI